MNNWRYIDEISCREVTGGYLFTVGLKRNWVDCDYYTSSSYRDGKDTREVRVCITQQGNKNAPYDTFTIMIDKMGQKYISYDVLIGRDRGVVDIFIRANDKNESKEMRHHFVKEYCNKPSPRMRYNNNSRRGKFIRHT